MDSASGELRERWQAQLSWAELSWVEQYSRVEYSSAQRKWRQHRSNYDISNHWQKEKRERETFCIGGCGQQQKTKKKEEKKKCKKEKVAAKSNHNNFFFFFFFLLYSWQVDLLFSSASGTLVASVSVPGRQLWQQQLHNCLCSSQHTHTHKQGQRAHMELSWKLLG